MSFRKHFRWVMEDARFATILFAKLTYSEPERVADLIRSCSPPDMTTEEQMSDLTRLGVYERFFAWGCQVLHFRSEEVIAAAKEVVDFEEIPPVMEGAACLVFDDPLWVLIDGDPVEVPFMYVVGEKVDGEMDVRATIPQRRGGSYEEICIWDLSADGNTEAVSHIGRVILGAFRVMELEGDTDLASPVIVTRKIVEEYVDGLREICERHVQERYPHLEEAFTPDLTQTLTWKGRESSYRKSLKRFARGLKFAERHVVLPRDEFFGGFGWGLRIPPLAEAL